MTTLDLETRAQKAQSELSPKLQAALRYVLDHRDEIAMQSMRTLAAACDVTPPTMLRLARRLGYADWNELRDEIQARMRGKGEGLLTERMRNLVSRADGGPAFHIAAEMVAEDERNLSRTWADIRSEQLEAAVADLLSARRVLFLGRRSCHPVAFGMHYSYQMVRDNGTLVADYGGGIGNAFIELEPEDAVVVIGFEPYSRETVQLCRHAIEQGACLVTITDKPLSPLARGARHQFIAHNDTAALFQSIIAAQSVGQALIALITAADGDAAVQRMQTREARLQRLGAYWSDDS